MSEYPKIAPFNKAPIVLEIAPNGGWIVSQEGRTLGVYSSAKEMLDVLCEAFSGPALSRSVSVETGAGRTDAAE